MTTISAESAASPPLAAAPVTDDAAASASDAVSSSESTSSGSSGAGQDTPAVTISISAEAIEQSQQTVAREAYIVDMIATTRAQMARDGASEEETGLRVKMEERALRGTQIDPAEQETQLDRLSTLYLQRHGKSDEEIQRLREVRAANVRNAREQLDINKRNEIEFNRPRQPNMEGVLCDTGAPQSLIDAVRAVTRMTGDVGGSSIFEASYASAQVRDQIRALQGDEILQRSIASGKIFDANARASAFVSGPALSRFGIDGPAFSEAPDGKLKVNSFTLKNVGDGYSMAFDANTSEYTIFKQGVDITDGIIAGTVFEKPTKVDATSVQANARNYAIVQDLVTGSRSRRFPRGRSLLNVPSRTPSLNLKAPVTLEERVAFFRASLRDMYSRMGKDDAFINPVLDKIEADLRASAAAAKADRLSDAEWAPMVERHRAAVAAKAASTGQITATIAITPVVAVR